METASIFAKPTREQYFDSMSLVDYQVHLSLSGAFYTKINHIQTDELVFISIIPDDKKHVTRYFYPDGEQFKK